MHTEALDLRELIIFLVGAGLAVLLLHRVGVGPVLGFLAVGLVIGPFGPARFVEHVPSLAYAVVADLEGVRALAELGVVFLLSMIGLELSIDRLWAMRGSVFGLGGAQVIGTSMVNASIASLFDNMLPAAMVLGAGLALSSTAIGQTCFALLLLQVIWRCCPSCSLFPSSLPTAGDRAVPTSYGMSSNTGRRLGRRDWPSPFTLPKRPKQYAEALITLYSLIFLY
jgi:Sodium/hydrogen exchanger family